jgi:hypothetical protein
MPRRSAEAASFIPSIIGRAQHLQPPALLTDAERRAFIEIVGGKRPEHFQSSDIPLIVEYARTIVELNTGWSELRVKTDKTEARAAINAAQKNLMSLARMLKLSPLARVPTTPARPGVKAPPPTTLSYYDHTQLETANGSDDE